MNDDKLPEPLERALSALDQDARRAAGRVDPARTGEAVLRRLKSEPALPAARPARGARWMRAAAAIAVLVAGGVTGRALLTPGESGGPNVPVAFDVESLSVDQGEALLAAVDGLPTSADSAPAQVITVYDLNETELQSLLQSMESSEGTL